MGERDGTRGEKEEGITSKKHPPGRHSRSRSAVVGISAGRSQSAASRAEERRSPFYIYCLFFLVLSFLVQGFVADGLMSRARPSGGGRYVYSFSVGELGREENLQGSVSLHKAAITVRGSEIRYWNGLIQQRLCNLRSKGEEEGKTG